MSTIREGDVGTVFTLVLEDENGDAVDLTAATSATIRFLKPDGTAISDDATISQTPTDGTVTYTVGADIFDVIGRWYWEVTVAYAGSGAEWTSEPLSFDVEGKF